MRRRGFFYDRIRCRGKTSLALAFVAIAGWALAAPRPAAAAQAVQPTFDDLEQRPTPEETYAANAFAIVSVKGGGNWWRPVRGIYRLTTEHGTFFHAMGRPDLAQQYARRYGTGVLLEVLGYAAGVGGLGLLGWGVINGHTLPAIAGAGLVVAWPILVYVGGDMKKPELPPDDALDMAGRYNDALRARLRLAPPRDDGTVAARARRRSLPAVAPFVTRAAAGVMLGVRF
jgi:hypothetical protein